MEGKKRLKEDENRGGGGGIKVGVIEVVSSIGEATELTGRKLA